MKNPIARYTVVMLVMMLSAVSAGATHLRSAEIKVERSSCTDLTYKITLTVFLNSASGTAFGGFTLDDGHITFGDGSFLIIPETAATLRPDLGNEVSVVTFITFHTYASPGFYKINYFERDRSDGVLNISNAEDTAYSSSISIRVDTDCLFNRFPVLAFPPVDRTCPGVTFFHSSGASDADGDSLSYELIVPARSATDPVFGYKSPSDPSFYTDYNTGNEANNGPPVFSIDPETGLITWDAPGFVGEYNIAFTITEWREDADGNDQILSVTVRDMQILVEDCVNGRPDLTVPGDLCITEGTVLDYTIRGHDPENNLVKIETASEILTWTPDKLPATIDPSTVEFRASNPPDEIDFHWTTDCLHVRDQPYQVVFKITDQPNFGTQLVTFRTWKIKVMAPPPVWTGSSLDVVNRHAVLSWNAYTCANAEAIQVWRKVGGYTYTPGVCDGGIPKSLGYELVGSVDPGATTFTDTNRDKGLSVGALYCYRLVAVFKAPAGGRSYTSTEVCIGPIRADAPVITHATVEKTSIREGAVRVSWRSPFNIDATQFPRPYQYEIYRGTGFAGEDNLVLASGRVADTTFLDAGIDTDTGVYNYRIVVYSKPDGSADFIPVDTSATASTVRLQATPGTRSIALRWQAEVPWSNVAQAWPWHYIYRGQGDDAANNLVLIDSVNVAESEEFLYVDDGGFQQQPIREDEIYCYRVETVGTYGNPAIAPQHNFSQLVFSYPVNSLLPCPPVLTVDYEDCEKFLQASTCVMNDLRSSFHWTPVVTAGCRKDIKSYRVYGADNATGEFVLLADNVIDTFFVETGLSSFARCYRVVAVDGLGQVSEPSEPDCNENCPYYELPNVFTPNNDGCNDRFSAYSDPASEGEEAPCHVADGTRCPRFVKTVSLRVFNRWGRELYTYTSGDSRSIYIEWDGRDRNGNLLDPAVYYYIADVTFDTVDPAKRERTMKGWVHLMR